MASIIVILKNVIDKYESIFYYHFYLILFFVIFTVNTHQDSDLFHRLSKEFRQKKIQTDQLKGTFNHFTPKRSKTAVFTSEAVTPTDWPVSVGDQTLLHSVVQENRTVDSRRDPISNRNVRLNVNRNLNTNEMIEAGTNKLRTLWPSKTYKMKMRKARFGLKKEDSANFLQAKFWKDWKKAKEQLKTSYIRKPRPSGIFNYRNEKSRMEALLQSDQNFSKDVLITSVISKQKARHKYQRNHQTISNNINSVSSSTSSDRLALTDRRNQVELPRRFVGRFLQQDSKTVKPESPILGSVLGIAKKTDTQRQVDRIEKVIGNNVSSPELVNKYHISKNVNVSSLSEANMAAGIAPSESKIALNRGQIKEDIVVHTRNLPSIFSIRKDDAKLLEKPASLVSQVNAVENSGITLEKNLRKGRNQLSQVESLKVLGLSQPKITDVRHLNRKNLNIDKDLLRINKIINEANATKMSRSKFDTSNFVSTIGSFNVFSKKSDPIRSVLSQDKNPPRLNLDISLIKKKVGSSNVDNITGSRLATALIKRLMRNGGSFKSGLKWNPIKSNSLQAADFQRNYVKNQSKQRNVKQHREATANKTLNKMKLNKTVLNFLAKLSTYLQLRSSNKDQPLKRSQIPSVDSKVLTLLGLPDIKTDLSALFLLNETAKGKFPFQDVRLVDSGKRHSLQGLHGISKTIVSSSETKKMAQSLADTRRPGNSHIVKDVRDNSSSHLQADRQYLKKPLDLNNAKTTQVDWGLHGLLRQSDVVANVSTLLKLGSSDVGKLPKRRKNLVDLRQIKAWNSDKFKGRFGRKTDFADLAPLNVKESYNVPNTAKVLRGSIKRPLDILKKIRDKNLQELSVSSPIIKPDMPDSDILSVLETLGISNTVLANISEHLELGKSLQNKSLPREIPISPSMKTGMPHSGILGLLKSLDIPNKLFANISTHFELGKSFSKKSLPGEIATLKKVFANISAILKPGKSFQNKSVSREIPISPLIKPGLLHSGILGVLKSIDIPNKLVTNISAYLKLGKSFSNTSLPSEIPTLASIKLGLQNPSISKILSILSSTNAYVDLLQGARRNNRKSSSVDSSILSQVISPGTSKDAFAKLPFILKPTKSAVFDETALTRLKPDLAHLLSVGKLLAAGVPFDSTVNASAFMKLGILDKVNRFELLKAKPDLTSVNLLDVLKPLYGSSFILSNVSKPRPLDAGKLANLFEDRPGLVSVDINLLGVLVALGVPPNILANIFVQLATLGVPDIEKETLQSFLETRNLLRQLGISNEVFKNLPKAPAIALDNEIFISKVLPELLKVDLRNLPSNNSSRILGKVLTTLMTIIGNHKPKTTGLVDVLRQVHKEDALRQVYTGKQRTDGSNVSSSRLSHANKTDFQISKSLVAEQNFEKLSLIETVFLLEILNKLCIKQLNKSAICDATRQYTTTSLVTDIMGLAFKNKEQRNTPFSIHSISTDASLKLCLSASFSSFLYPFCQRVVTTGTKPPLSSTLVIARPEISKQPEFREISREFVNENKTDATSPTQMLSLPILLRGTAASAVPPIPTSRLSFSQISNVGSKKAESSRTSLLYAFGSVKLCQDFPDLCNKIEYNHISKAPTNIAELLKKMSTKKQPPQIRSIVSSKVAPKIMSLNMVQKTLRSVLPGSEGLSHICPTAALLNVQSILSQNSTNMASSASSATAMSFLLSQLLEIIGSKILPGSEARPLPTPLTQMLSSGVNLLKPYLGHRDLLLPRTEEFKALSYLQGQGSTTTRPYLHSFTSSNQEPPIDKFINLCASVSIKSPLFPLCQQARKAIKKTSHPVATAPPATQTSVIDLFRQLMKRTNENRVRRVNGQAAKPFTTMSTSTTQSNTPNFFLKSSALPNVRHEKQAVFLEDFAKFLQKLMQRYNEKTMTNKTDKNPTSDKISMPTKTISNAIRAKAARKNTLATTHKSASLRINRNAISSAAYKMLLSKTIKTDNKASSKNRISLKARTISGKTLPTSVEAQVKINNLITSRLNTSHPMTSSVSGSPLIDVRKKLLSVLERHLGKISPPVRSTLQEIRKKPEVITTIRTPSETTLLKRTTEIPLLSPRVPSPSNNLVLIKPERKVQELKRLSYVYKPESKLSNYLTKQLGKSGSQNKPMSYPKETIDERVSLLIPSLLSRQRAISSILRRMGYLQANERHFPLTSNRYRKNVNDMPFPILHKKDSQRQKSRYPILFGPPNGFNRTANSMKLHERIYPQMEQSSEPQNHVSGINTSKMNALLRILNALHQSDFKSSVTRKPQYTYKDLTMQRYMRLLDEEPISQKSFLRANSKRLPVPNMVISRRIPVGITRDLSGGKKVGNSPTKGFWHAILAPQTLNLNIRSIQVPVGKKEYIAHSFDQKVSPFNTGKNSKKVFHLI